MCRWQTKNPSQMSGLPAILNPAVRACFCWMCPVRWLRSSPMRVRILAKLWGVVSVHFPPRPAAKSERALAGQNSMRDALPRLLATFVHREFLVKPRDHFADAGLGKTFGADRVGLLQTVQPLFENAELFSRLLVLHTIGN